MAKSLIVGQKLKSPVLRQNNPLKTLNYIYNQLLVTPEEKADVKIGFISNWFYAVVPIKELCLDYNSNGTNITHIPVHLTKKQVISGNTRFSRKKFSLVTDEENKKLPNNYWIPKLHNPLDVHSNCSSMFCYNFA